MQLSVPWRYGQVKPFGSIPRINRNHPLAYGLQYYGYDVGGGVVIDLVNGKQAQIYTAAGVNPTPSSGKCGSGFVYNGATASAAGLVAINLEGTNVSTFGAAAPYSVATGFFPNSATLAANRYITCIGSTTVDNVGIASSGGGQPEFLIDSGTNTHVFTNSYTNFAYNTAVVTVITSTSGNCYLNGKLDSALTTVTWTFSTTSEQIIFNGGTAQTGGGGGTSGGLFGFIYWQAGWNRVLSATEIQALHQDPYAILLYPEDDIFATMVGGLILLPQRLLMM